MTPPEGGGRLAFLVLGLVWSTGLPLARLAGNAGIPHLVFPFAQAFGASLVLGLILMVARRHEFGARPQWLLFLVAGLFGHALPQIATYVVTQNLPIGVVGLIISTNPLLTGGLAALTGTEAMTLRKLTGILLGFAGVAIIALPGAGLPGRDGVFWLAIALLTPICFAIANVYSARLRREGSGPTANAFGMMTVSAIVLLIAIFLTGSGYWPDMAHLNAGDGALIAHGLLAGPAFFLFFIVLARGGPVMVASSSYMILVLSTLLGWLVFAERPSAGFYLAAGFVIAGLTVLLSASKRTGLH